MVFTPESSVYTVRHTKHTNIYQDYQILVMFGTSISDATCHQTTSQVRTLPNMCFCTTWEN